MVWEKFNLGEICENLDSKRVPITKKDRKEGQIPYYGASGIVDYVADYIFDDDLLLVSEDGANLLARTYPIAFSITGKTWVNNHAHVLKFNSPTTQSFIEYYLNTISLSDYVSGMAQPKLNQKSLNSILVPYPPEAEQKRIVAILDQAFAEIDKARTNAEQNLKNARELFNSYSQKVFSQGGDGWINMTVGEVLSLEYGKPLDKSVRKEDGLYPAYGANGVKCRSDSYYCDFKSIIVGRKGSAGELTISEERFWPLDVTYFVKFDIEKHDLYFIYYLLSLLNLPNLATGVKPGINRNNVYSIGVSIPDIMTQKDVATKLFALSKEVTRLEKIYKLKLLSLNELKKSILQKAFSGELTNSKGLAA